MSVAATLDPGFHPSFSQALHFIGHLPKKLNADVTRPAPGHFKRQQGLSTGKSRPRVQTSVSRSNSAWFVHSRLDLRLVVQVSVMPTVSAITAPRAPSGFAWPTVESRAVWCSISALSSAPSRTTMVEIHSHIITPTTAPKEP